jgi:hypothetical protein
VKVAVKVFSFVCATPIHVWRGTLEVKMILIEKRKEVFIRFAWPDTWEYLFLEVFPITDDK